MTTRPYIIKQGDHLAKVAALYGFDGSQVWQDPKNGDLRSKRKDPDQLVAGDVLYIPDARPQWMSLKIGATNTFVVNVARVKVTVRFVSNGAPLANERYVIDGVEGGKGTTDADGNVHCEVPATTDVARIRFVDRREVHTARVGHLDPVDELSGARQRLAALGTFGRADGSPVASAAALKDALRAFQRANKLTATGELDADTQAKLVELHGS
jgi:hypothetical protein